MHTRILDWSGTVILCNGARKFQSKPSLGTRRIAQNITLTVYFQESFVRSTEPHYFRPVCTFAVSEMHTGILDWSGTEILCNGARKFQSKPSSGACRIAQNITLTVYFQESFVRSTEPHCSLDPCVLLQSLRCTQEFSTGQEQ